MNVAAIGAIWLQIEEYDLRIYKKNNSLFHFFFFIKLNKK